MKQKILILGISSFAGASFAKYILDNKNYKIYGTFNKRDKFTTRSLLKEKNYFKNLKLYKLDLSKNNNLLNLIYKIEPEYIYDFASICMVNESWSDPGYYFKVNVNSK